MAKRPEAIDDPSECEYSLACQYYNQNRFEDARIMYERAYKGYTTTKGPTYRPQFYYASQLINFYMRQDLYDTAIHLFTSSGLRAATERGVSSLWVLEATQDMGILYRMHNELDKAEQLLERAQRGFLHTHGLDSELTLDATFDLALLYSLQNRSEIARMLFHQVEKGFEQKFGSRHLSTLMAVHHQGLQYEFVNKLQEAEVFYIRALEGFEALGTEDAQEVDERLTRLRDRITKEAQARRLRKRATSGGPDTAKRTKFVQSRANVNLRQQSCPR